MTDNPDPERAQAEQQCEDIRSAQERVRGDLPRIDSDPVEINFDWGVPQHAGESITFHVRITRRSQQSAISFVIDLEKLAVADLQTLYVLSDHAGIGWHAQSRGYSTFRCSNKYRP